MAAGIKERMFKWILFVCWIDCVQYACVWEGWTQMNTVVSIESTGVNMLRLHLYVHLAKEGSQREKTSFISVAAQAKVIQPQMNAFLANFLRKN